MRRHLEHQCGEQPAAAYERAINHYGNRDKLDDEVRGSLFQNQRALTRADLKNYPFMNSLMESFGEI